MTTQGSPPSAAREHPFRQAIRDAAFQSSPLGLVVVDGSGRVVDLGSAVETISGRARGDALGMPVEWLLGLEPGHLDREILWAVVRDGIWRGEFGFVRNDGEMGRAEAMAVALQGGPAELQRHLLLVVRDVTAARAAESTARDLELKLRRAATEWQRTFDAVDAAVLLLDPAGRVRRLNRAALAVFGGSYQDHIGQRVGQLEPRRLSTAIEDLLAQAPRRPASEGGFVGGSRVPGFALSLSAAVDDSGEVESFVVLAREQPTPGADESRDTAGAVAQGLPLNCLVGGLCHDLRNPLFAISAAVTALRRRPEMPAVESELYEALAQDVTAMTDLLRQLEDFGADLRVTLLPCRLDEVAAEVLAAAMSRAAERGILLDGELARPTWAIADRDLTRRALELLVEETLAASSAGDVVAVECSTGGDAHAAWTIHDSGPAPHSLDLDRAFEPYYLHRRRGAGLSLALAGRLVTAQGGSASARRSPRQGGLQVTFSWPGSAHRRS
jgi:PAS domain S-box-containing protein